MSEKKLELWLSFGKAIVITGGLGVLAQCGHSTYQNAQVKIEEANSEAAIAIKKAESQAAIDKARIENENAYLSEYVRFALEQSVDRRHRLARYFAALSDDRGYGQGWKRYLADVVRERNAKEEELAEKRVAEAEAKSEEERERLRLRISELEADLAEHRKAEPIELQFNAESVDFRELSETAACPEGQKMRLRPVNLSTEGKHSFWPELLIKGLVDYQQSREALDKDQGWHQIAMLPLVRQLPIRAAIARECYDEADNRIGPAVVFLGSGETRDLSDPAAGDRVTYSFSGLGMSDITSSTIEPK